VLFDGLVFACYARDYWSSYHRSNLSYVAERVETQAACWVQVCRGQHQVHASNPASPIDYELCCRFRKLFRWDWAWNNFASDHAEDEHASDSVRANVQLSGKCNHLRSCYLFSLLRRVARRLWHSVWFNLNDCSSDRYALLR